MFHSLFHRLTHNPIKNYLMCTFITSGSVIAQWSLRVAAVPAGHLLAALIKVTGAGMGAVCMTIESTDAGLIRNVTCRHI